MSERTDELIIPDTLDFITRKQTETISIQMEKSICMIKGKSTGTGFFCCLNFENIYIPCLMTSYQVIDDKYIKENKKIEISLNDNEIKEEIKLSDEDIMYISKENEYNLIIIKLIDVQEYMKYINYLELDDNLFNNNSLKGYESIYILHYPNYQNSAVSYGKGIIYDPNYKYDIQHKCHTLPSSSGGPILNLLTNKVIGIHKGNIQKNSEIKYNIGTFLKDPLEEIKNKDNKINDQIKNDNLYNDFNIKLKEPIHELRYHTAEINCLAVMNDGRLVSGSLDKSIIIYNKETFKPDLVIKEHSNWVNCIIQLRSGILASCSKDKSIKLLNIKGNEYNFLQSLRYHKDSIRKIIELNNKVLVSCSNDSSIIFYKYDDSEYEKDYQISTNGPCSSIIQTKENEICYYNVDNDNDTICFFDMSERKVKASISNISTSDMIMIEKDLLLIPGFSIISIININKYELVRNIDVKGSFWIDGICILNKNMLLTGDRQKNLKQWKIKDDDLILIDKKEDAHNRSISNLVNLGNGHIASGCDIIKIW